MWFGSTMWNRPIVVAPLVGLALGDLDTGIKLGATLELVFMGAFPVGASIYQILFRNDYCNSLCNYEWAINF